MKYKYKFVIEGKFDTEATWSINELIRRLNVRINDDDTPLKIRVGTTRIDVQKIGEEEK